MVLLFRIAAAITTGAVLVHGAYSVGPYGAALPGPARWACVRRGEVVPVVERTPVVESLCERDRSGWSADWRYVESHEWSAYGAALAFVCAVGERAAMRALKTSEVGAATSPRRAAVPSRPAEAPTEPGTPTCGGPRAYLPQVAHRGRAAQQSGAPSSSGSDGAAPGSDAAGSAGALEPDVSSGACPLHPRGDQRGARTGRASLEDA